MIYRFRSSPRLFPITAAAENRGILATPKYRDPAREEKKTKPRLSDQGCSGSRFVRIPTTLKRTQHQYELVRVSMCCVVTRDLASRAYPIDREFECSGARVQARGVRLSITTMATLMRQHATRLNTAPTGSSLSVYHHCFALRHDPLHIAVAASYRPGWILFPEPLTRPQLSLHMLRLLYSGDITPRAYVLAPLFRHIPPVRAPISMFTSCRPPRAPPSGRETRLVPS